MSNLTGRTVVVTRAVGQAEEFIRALDQEGANVIHVPVMKFVEPDSWAACDEALQDIQTYDWLVFTSVNGVRFFLRRIAVLTLETSILDGIQIAAVGRRTAAELESSGLLATLIPEHFSATGLVREFREMDLRQHRLLIVSPQNERDYLIENLQPLARKVQSVPVYKNEPPVLDEKRRLAAFGDQNGPDVVTFTSPSSVDNFTDIVGESRMLSWHAAGCRFAAIGDSTRDSLLAIGADADVIPAQATIPDFVNAIASAYE